jgi:hypothetical protein
MPSLIRFLILLLFLAGLVFGGMVALVALVEPEQREVSVRIPTRDLLGEPGGGGPTAPSALPDLMPDEEETVAQPAGGQ